MFRLKNGETKTSKINKHTRPKKLIYVPEEVLLIVAGDMNCHIGSVCDGFDVMGCFCFGVRNQEEKNMVGLCQEHNLRVMISYYRKRLEHLITSAFEILL